MTPERMSGVLLLVCLRATAFLVVSGPAKGGAFWGPRGLPSRGSCEYPVYQYAALLPTRARRPAAAAAAGWAVTRRTVGHRLDVREVVDEVAAVAEVRDDALAPPRGGVRPEVGRAVGLRDQVPEEPLHLAHHLDFPLAKRREDRAVEGVVPARSRAAPTLVPERRGRCR